MAKPQKRKKKGAILGWGLLVVLLMLAETVETGGGFGSIKKYIEYCLWRLKYRPESFETYVPFILAAIAVVAVCALIGKALQKTRDARTDGSVKANRSGRVSAAVQRRDPRTRSFTPPEPSCIVCDHTGEDHFQRDKTTRIRQLDEWLKNGLIDREEYRVLKSRYERNL